MTIVTGATGHLGKSICRGLAQAGSSLAICSTNQARANEFALELSDSYNIMADGFECDLQNISNIKSIIAAIYARFERIDCLVNNA